MSADKQTRSKNRKSRSDFQRLRRRFMSGLLRSLFLIHKPTRLGQAGFVLPTTVLLLLVLTLTVGALSFRSFSRSGSAIALREQQVIDSAAAPTIDRAKSKLEYLFSKDTRLPGGVPASDVLASMMLNGGGVSALPADPYTFPREERLDINGDGTLDNAWWFKSDVNGDGNEDDDEIIVYSILMDDANDMGDVVNTMGDDSAKARALVTRNGPINTAEALTGCGASRAPEEGWQGLNEATLQKNFQVTAFVANRSDVNRTASTLEFQQVRQADKGNKWGAWFKYDMELFPGSSRDFVWNGAMHTEGNLIANERFVARMISSHNSCLYNRSASEITLGEKDGFQGQLLAAQTGSNKFYSDKPAQFHLFQGDGVGPTDTGNSVKLTKSSDSVSESSDAKLENILLDPIQLFTENFLAHRNEGAGDGWERPSSWEVDSDFVKNNHRIYNDPEAKTPYLDDTYRADNRYGPKSVYDDNNEIPLGETVGGTITGNTALTDLDTDNDLYGLDGYWERRSIGQGLRVIVGQRLELGNSFGWGSNNDPLYPPITPPNSGYDLEDSSYMATGDTNNDSGDDDDVFTEEIQRRTLYDNLAAVQGMVVYHHESDDGTLPLACIASTVHPGTSQTVKNSRTFKTDLGKPTNIDFFSGNATNGWEFDFYSPFSSKVTAGQPLGTALRNLAYFAGDPLGGAPSFKPEQDLDPSVVHPYPYQAMWGDFSNLRRVVDSGVAYDDLSPADQSTLHSAACTLGMLAYNIKTVEDDYGSLIPSDFNTIADKIIQLTDGNTANKEIGPAPYNQYTAEKWIKKLEEAGANVDHAKLISKRQQIQRDSQLGFDAGCEATIFDSSGVEEAKKSQLKIAFCSDTQRPKYPSLYYLFPTAAHDQVGTQLSINEEYLEQPSYLATSNAGVTYSIVTAADIALTPQARANWKLPTAVSSSTSFNPDALQIDVDSNLIEVSLLDKAMFDGREHMSVRLLDFDVDKLSDHENSSDSWISYVDGIVYAFREDAVREDSIVRPKDSGTDWAACDTWEKVHVPYGETLSEAKRNCRMKVISSYPFLQDPPLKDDTLVSTKPIDFYADPDRRPNGFRLINGAKLNRPTAADDDVLSGMTFVSDNMVYIKGDFNLHTSSDAACANLLEEFTKRLDNNCDGTEDVTGGFYNGRTKTDFNYQNFAKSSVDSWRPIEIVGDAVGILSGRYRDGSIEDGFVIARKSSRRPGEPSYGGNTARGNGISSYMNQNRPKDTIPAASSWARVNPDDDTAPYKSPILIDRDGQIIKSDRTTAYNRDDLLQFIDKRDNWNDRRGEDVQLPSPTRVNAVLISGIVPSQAGQSYGGMHNFPRLLEWWQSINLTISGGFFQLNFSTSATAPYDADAWEPGSSPTKESDRITYYGAADRSWGYDVGLQYAPAGPIARRFVTIGQPRSEFYRELPVDDAYVLNLRCAKYVSPDDGQEKRVDKTVNTALCPDPT